jgi:hypothetical protein
MTPEERLDKIEKKIDYLVKLIEDLTMNRGDRRNVSSMINTTMKMLEDHPAMQTPSAQDMLNNVLKPLTEDIK